MTVGSVIGSTGTALRSSFCEIASWRLSVVLSLMDDKTAFLKALNEDVPQPKTTWVWLWISELFF